MITIQDAIITRKSVRSFTKKKESNKNETCKQMNRQWKENNKNENPIKR